MYIGLQGVQIGQTAGAASATKLPFLIGFAATQLQPNAALHFDPTYNPALPAAQTINASAVAVFESSNHIQKQASVFSALKSDEQRLADSMNATTADLWKLAARFLQTSDAFTAKLASNEASVKPARAKVTESNKVATHSVQDPTTPSKPVQTDGRRDAEPKPIEERAKIKNNASVTLMDSGIEVEFKPLELPSMPRTGAAVSTDKVSIHATPKQVASPKVDTAIAKANGPFESVVPHSVSQLDRARTILLSARAIGKKMSTRNSSEASRAMASDSCDTFRSSASQRRLRGIPTNGRRATSKKFPTSHPFQKSQAVGRSPAFLVGKIETRKTRRVEPAQIVRIAIAGKASRRIVFARVPETKGEYRFAGIEHQQRRLESLRRSAPHALATPHAERQTQPTSLALAPRGAGESAYTMPDPRELRSDERRILMSLIKKQLSMGPASLDDPKIREHFNGFMFSNTVGEMSHYVTSDQWNAMVRAAILYAARAVLPFSNNSITGMAAEYLFDEDDIDSADAERRYDEWLAHFGISGIGDFALMDTFADEDRVLTMPEYFLKGIMDYLTELAPLMHAYDEEAMPFPFTTELHLQWETIALVHDPAISNDEELVYVATVFAEEMAALDVQAAQHFVELVLLSTRVNTDSIQGMWGEDQAVAFLVSSIQAGLSDVLNPIGRNNTLPRYVRRLLAKAKEAKNAQEDKYELGLEMLTKNLADAIQSGAFSIEMEEDELRLN